MQQQDSTTYPTTITPTTICTRQTRSCWHIQEITLHAEVGLCGHMCVHVRLQGRR